MESKRNETFAMIFLGPEDIQMTWSTRQGSHKVATRSEMRPGGRARHPPMSAPHDSTDLFLPPIYSQISQNLLGEPRKYFYTAATFCTREVLSMDLLGRPTGGDSIMEGFYINTITSPMKPW